MSLSFGMLIKNHTRATRWIAQEDRYSHFSNDSHDQYGDVEYEPISPLTDEQREQAFTKDERSMEPSSTLKDRVDLLIQEERRVGSTSDYEYVESPNDYQNLDNNNFNNFGGNTSESDVLF